MSNRVNNPLASNDYRSCVQAGIERLRYKETLTYAELAKNTQIQTTYLTNVLKGRAHFNADQLFSIIHRLGFNNQEQEYCLLLLDWERAQNPKRRDLLKARIEMIQTDNLKTKKHLKLESSPHNGMPQAEYYLDPWLMILHVFLQIPKYAKNPKEILKKLPLSESQLTQLLTTLERLKFIEIQKNGFAVLKKGRILPEDSPLCVANQTLLRIKALEQIQKLSTEKRYNTSFTISANEKVRLKIQSMYLDFLKEVEILVHSCNDETDVYQINFDLFPWST